LADPVFEDFSEIGTRRNRIDIHEHARRLKPGAVLVREYRGERHTVTVVPEGFSWKGMTYTSLSTIARAITGTAWNGPRFFGLREAGRKQLDGSALSSALERKAHRGRRPCNPPA
jgi:hypothetical protein